MLLIENIQLALEGLTSNKMRSFLTMLGIIIGIGSVIAIVTVGNSMTSSVTSSMQELGATNIILNVRAKDSDNFNGPMSGDSGSITESDLISDEMIENYTEIYGNNIKAISLSTSGGSGKVTEGGLYANITVSGVNEGYGVSSNVEIIDGRFLREGDIKASRYVAVVSDKLVGNMFTSGENPLGKEVKATVGDSIQTFTIVGVYKHEQSSFAMMGGSSVSDKDIRTNLYIPVTTCKKMNSSDSGYQMVTVMAETGVDTAEFSSDSKKFFNTYYTNNTRYEVDSINMESMVSRMTGMLSTLSIAVAVIAAISLVVGGIGVMNIMLVSVTERTREIGTRKALGAKKSFIRVQFIVEAAIICGIGGLFGVMLGVALGYLASALLGFASFPSIAIIIIAVLFSMMIGVFFGYYPANKAAKLNPIEALRYE